MSTTTPRPEHPRPDFERRTWQNLNGRWQFAVDTARCGMEKGWQSGANLPMRITVPFCPESKLSGLGLADFLEGVWYRRKFRVDRALRSQRLLLNFGAVDYEARVWVNGNQVIRHRGGYTPFSVDITDAVDMNGENEIVVYAVDDERTHFQPMGRQCSSLRPYHGLHTRTTGIWQTVWLESAPETRVSSLTVWPDAANGRATVQIGLARTCRGLSLEAEALADGERVVVAKSAQAGLANLLVLEIPSPVLWDVGKPHLYDLKVRVLDRSGRTVDEVNSYFGLRDVCTEGDRVLINGRSVFLRLVQDLGFWPDGIYTAPSDDELRADIERGMACGFNGARLHQKIFEPRTLYWADKLGYLLWSEFPDWSCAVRYHAQARENLVREWTNAVLRDRSHPSVIAWIPLNEAHPASERYDPTLLVELYELTKRLDPSRLMLDASGHTHVKTDVWDLHDYDRNAERFAARYTMPDRTGEAEPDRRSDTDEEISHAAVPVVVSECGGFAWKAERDQQSREYWEKTCKDEADFLDRIRSITGVLLDNPHIAGLCYEMLTDVEQEVHGLYTYDRKPKFAPKLLREALARKAAIED